MDAVVFVDDVAHCVSGVADETTCSQVIHALAHATNKRGQFILIARSDKDLDNNYRFASEDKLLRFIVDANAKGKKFDLLLIQISSQLDNNTSGNDSLNGFHNDIGSFRFNDELDPYKLIPNNSMSSIHSEVSNSDKNSGIYRSPPPDYNQVLEGLISKRSAVDVSRTPLTFLNIPNFSLRDLYERNFSREELETLIDIQDRILVSQKEEILRMETMSLNPLEREILQLTKQHRNLRFALDSLRSFDLQRQISSEEQESERLNTAIAAMKTAIENKGRELYDALQLQKSLEMQASAEKLGCF